MIKTYYGLAELHSPGALFLALMIGFFFGLSLERAGFGSSKRLSGIFYFRDMAVLKVMFTALLTAMFGLNMIIGLGLIDPATQIYFMPTYYGAYIVAGLIFGVGFVMSGWCPGTSAVGIASGKVDALVFFGGAIVGSILFNELFPVIKPLYTWGQSDQNSFGQPGLAFIYTSLGVSKAGFIKGFTLMAIGCFWGAEYIEGKRPEATGLKPFITPFFKSFSLCFLLIALSLSVFSDSKTGVLSATRVTTDSETHLLAQVEEAEDHMAPEVVAERLFQKDPSLRLVDVRPASEFLDFHIRGAENVTLPELPAYMSSIDPSQTVVLYSNGMTHPVQARDSLSRLGYGHVYIMTDGLTGFIEECLKPPSLRPYPLTPASMEQIRSWRNYFLASTKTPEQVGAESPSIPVGVPGLVDSVWLESRIGRDGLRIIDTREQSDYNRNHIPGSVALNVESVRSALEGVPSILLTGEILVSHVSLAGIAPSDRIVIIYGGDRVRDATLMAMALERIGHRDYAILNVGYEAWLADKRPMTTAFPDMSRTAYPLPSARDHFTVSADELLTQLKKAHVTVLDTRPREYYLGEKSDEARAGHIPGAINRSYKEDLIPTGLKSVQELEAAYHQLIPNKKETVIVHCRTGHQASQTFFVLKHLLGYQQVYWYDGGWTEWAARNDLPVQSGG